MRTVDLTGMRFGALVAQFPVGKSNHKKVIWQCLCDCGQTKNVISNNLRSGGTISCGCLKKLIQSETSRRASTKHGHGASSRRSPTYRTWMNMRDRCNNPKAINYRWYGALGVTVCERWNRFENFIEDMGERPEGTTIDRKNPVYGYSKENCRWGTVGQQACNKRANLPLAA
jgi:hypothetical protein